MSNLETVQGIYQAFERGDFDSVIAALDPAIEWVEPELEGLLYGGVHRGVEAVANDVFALIPQTWEKVALQPEEWIDRGDTVVVIGQFNACAKGRQEEASWRLPTSGSCVTARRCASNRSSTLSRSREH
jgi:ketosteroid isomerase-like protein